jgi:hypothetical protein
LIKFPVPVVEEEVKSNKNENRNFLDILSKYIYWLLNIDKRSIHTTCKRINSDLTTDNKSEIVKIKTFDREVIFYNIQLSPITVRLKYVRHFRSRRNVLALHFPTLVIKLKIMCHYLYFSKCLFFSSLVCKSPKWKWEEIMILIDIKRLFYSYPSTGWSLPVAHAWDKIYKEITIYSVNL